MCAVVASVTVTATATVTATVVAGASGAGMSDAWTAQSQCDTVEDWLSQWATADDWSSMASHQNLVVPYVPTPISSVRRMLEMLQLQEQDVLLDLGSGDGRIAIQACLATPGVQSVGVELDEDLLAQSAELALQSGLSPAVCSFVGEDFLQEDLLGKLGILPTVITLYALPKFLKKLTPLLIRVLTQCGGRAVATVQWPLKDWVPCAQDDVLRLFVYNQASIPPHLRPLS